MLTKLIKILIAVPLVILLVVMSVANRHVVSFSFNPFQPDDAALALSGPFFLFLFVALIVGMFIGSISTWVSQGKHRKRARNEAFEAIKWQREADKHKTRADQVVAQALLPAAPSDMRKQA
jgi:uncharacterized integral membrane protein